MNGPEALPERRAVEVARWHGAADALLARCLCADPPGAGAVQLRRVFLKALPNAGRVVLVHVAATVFNVRTAGCLQAVGWVLQPVTDLRSFRLFHPKNL